MGSERAADELIQFDLNETERRLLRCGLVEWGGPARCTEELAVAMGFVSLADFWTERRRLIEAIEARVPLSRLDWVRVVLATEIVFVSDIVGSGRDWSIVTGLSDDLSVSTLRSIQEKAGKEFRSVLGNGFGLSR